ncbi:MAG: hypothetical protein K8R02_10030 [Anaerohalosphaeraceae bacterium]|nr:hypothetical protein [Anaerohalosphaeraceae bacterium]
MDTKEMVIQLVFTIVCCIATWTIAHLYYQRSKTVTPEWAKPLVEHFPEQEPTPEKLAQLFQEYLDVGDVEINPLLHRVVCPDCGESAKNFKKAGFGDDSHSIVTISCPNCGWSETVDVS